MIISLSQAIERKRKELLNSAHHHELISDEVLTRSRQLDDLVTLYLHKKESFLHVSAEKIHTTIHIQLKGQLDILTADELYELMAALLPPLENANDITIDLSQLEFTDSSRIEAFFQFIRQTIGKAIHISALNVNDSVSTALEMLEIHENLRELTRTGS